MQYLFQKSIDKKSLMRYHDIAKAIKEEKEVLYVGRNKEDYRRNSGKFKASGQTKPSDFEEQLRSIESSGCVGQKNRSRNETG